MVNLGLDFFKSNNNLPIGCRGIELSVLQRMNKIQ